ncbi:hypothetical protein SAMN05216436_108111 [bacterium A37T11]|nr:hypothetical protein SAMN05216436_108111 [bacterium A37T11]
MSKISNPDILQENFWIWVRQTLSGEDLMADKKEIDAEADWVMMTYHSYIGKWNTKRLQRYFRDQELLLGNMINQLPDGDLREALVRIWEHLHRYGQDYLDAQAVLPTALLALERQQNTEAFTPIKRAMKKAKVDGGLIKLLEDTFQFRCLPDGERVAIRKARYLRDLMPLLKSITEEPKSNLSLQERIVHLLCMHNLNSVQFYQWRRDQFLSQVPPAYPLMERLRIFRELLSNHTSDRQKNNRYFISGLPGIHKQVEGFLSGQVDLWEGVLRMTTQLKENGFLPIHIESILSVSQLALLFKVFRDCEVFTIPKPKRFFEFIANHFGSKQAQIFDPDTFRVDFYVFPTAHDAKVVFKIFKKLGEHMEREYGVAV